MLASQLLNNSYPTLGLTDKASLALQYMDEFDVRHLPVLADAKFLGLVSKEDLQDSDEEATLGELIDILIKKSVRADDYFFSVLKLSVASNLSIVPVVDEVGELIGSISEAGLVEYAARFIGVDEPGAVIVLEMERKNYSFGELSRLVETNDAYITQLNTSFDNDTGLIEVTIKINKLEVSDIIATFQRYEYVVKSFIGEEEYENELKHNFDHLMSYLKM